MLIHTKKKYPRGPLQMSRLDFYKKIFYLLFFESIFCSLFMSTCGLPSMSGLCKLLSDCANLVKRAVHRVRVA